MITMSHQQRAKSWLSFPHTLKDFIMMQGKKMFDALNKKKNGHGWFVLIMFVTYNFIFCRHMWHKEEVHMLLPEPSVLFECAHQRQMGLCGYLCVYCMCDYVTEKWHRGAVSFVTQVLITSKNCSACAQSARYKSTNSCSLQVSSFYSGKGCVLCSI